MNNLTWKACDTMKLNKDNINNQLSDAVILDVCTRIKDMGVTHIAIAPPMDTNAQYIANGTTPSSRTSEAHIQKWMDTIHELNLNVIFRGTFCGCESIWNFPYYEDGSVDALPIGTAASAATDGETTWCGRIRRFILTTVGASHWSNGDIFSPIPEATGHAFDGHAFWEDDTDSTTNYAAAFAAFKETADAAFSSISKSVTFISQNNFSELMSGWLPNSLTTLENIAGADYYGAYTPGKNQPSHYVSDWNTIYTNRSVKLFQGEWGLIADGGGTPTFTCHEDRLAYLLAFYKAYKTDLVDTDKMDGFSYWGGWEGQNTSLLYKDSNNNYQLNSEGKVLAAFYRNGGMGRVPVITAGTMTHNYRY